MIGNREFSIRVRKDGKTKTETAVSVEEDIRKKQVFTHFVQKMIFTGAVAIYGYVLVDTFRQVKVAQNIYAQNTD